MAWNWENPEWPNFRWAASKLAAAEEQFLLGSGRVVGTFKHLDDPARDQLTVEAMSGEALHTSRIEGDILDRISVQSSIQKQLGLASDQRRIRPAEQGISEMMVDLCRTFAKPLSSAMLFSWHRMMTLGRLDLADVGRYRTSVGAMQIVSGAITRPKVHFEAPPSPRIREEMKRFLTWFRRTSPQGASPLPAITRAGIAHLYFESIHPFEDGNGRLGRAIAEKAIAQSVAQPILLALATAIHAHQRGYYEALARASKRLEITEWLVWFAGVALDAQRRTLAQVEFRIAKTRLLDRLRDQINERQRKAILRMLEEGPEGFIGGLSAGNYATITGASPATTTRDLVDLTERGVLRRTGERKHARYSLDMPTAPEDLALMRLPDLRDAAPLEQRQ